MKFFAVIMAFLVIVLSCMPCADTSAMKSVDSKQPIAKTMESNDTGEHNDNCSPFCHCTCCSCTSINEVQIFTSFIPIYPSNTTTTYLPENTREISLPIWQPPQLV